MPNAHHEVRSDLYRRAHDLLQRTRSVQSAVLFGSAAKPVAEGSFSHPVSSDFDFHLVVSHPRSFEAFDWRHEFRENDYCFHICRKATGGVRKLTVVCSLGQIDMVLVPLWAMRLISFALWSGAYAHSVLLSRALNEMATCLHSGYEFVKGGVGWRELYEKVYRLPGVRLSDQDIIKMANVFLVDALWIFQKIESGEIIAATHAFHCRLIDTNLRLWREFRIRKGLSLPSFGLGRRAEAIASAEELGRFAISASCHPGDLKMKVSLVVGGMLALMGDISPEWRIPGPMQRLLESYQA